MRKDSERHAGNFPNRQGRKQIPVLGFLMASSSVHNRSKEELCVQGLSVPKAHLMGELALLFHFHH